jgi:ABC-type lipoprotein release transport system permease subunit
MTFPYLLALFSHLFNYWLSKKNDVNYSVIIKIVFGVYYCTVVAIIALLSLMTSSQKYILTIYFFSPLALSKSYYVNHSITSSCK